jgi:PAS domain S-box-containing protein
MAPAVLWPVLGALGAAGGTLALVWYLWDLRDRPGASWLIAVLGVQFVLTASYAVGYLVFDPRLRLAVEILFWVAYIWLGALFVAFGLAYTGRGHVIRSPFFGALVAFSVALSALVVTNPLHHVVWEGFRVLPPPGLATVEFTRKSGAILVLGVSALGAAVGTLLLVDTIVSYGRLYRAEALAVAISPLPPGIGFVLWTFGVAPEPGLNVAPVLFLLHVCIDAYAFVGGGMFDFHPATRRAGNRAAIADLGSPVVVVDEQERVVTLNPAAERTLGIESQRALTRPLADCYEGDRVDPTVTEQDATVRVAAGTRTFKITSTELADSTGTHLGYTLVFQDITDERRREQRLAVLNRVLRHNLRNDLTVVRMTLEEATDRADDDMAALLDPARHKTEGLVDLSEKARAFERVIDDEAESLVAVSPVVESVVSDARGESPEADLYVETTTDASVRTNQELLRVVVGNLVENAVEHGSTSPDSEARRDADGVISVESSVADAPEDAVEHGSTGNQPAADDAAEQADDGERPDVTVAVAADDDTVTVTVRDRGPGVPEHELAVIRDGDESALEHGSGLGLWIVQWGVTAAGGEIDFDTSDGTTATVTFPRTDASPDGSRAPDSGR